MYILNSCKCCWWYRTQHQIHNITDDNYELHIIFILSDCQTLFLISTGLLDQKCSTNHLIHISELIAQWRDIAPSLGLTPTDEQDIIGDAPFSIQRQRTGMLYKWSEKEGDNATYRKLAEIFKQCGRQDIVDKIKRLVTDGTGESMLSFNLRKFNSGNGQKKTYCYSCFGTPVKGLFSTR